MSSVHIDNLRLEVSGVSAETASAAMNGLDAELRRRLGSRVPDPGVNLPASLRLPPLETPPRIDAAQLRLLIADRLIELLAPRTTSRDEQNPEET